MINWKLIWKAVKLINQNKLVLELDNENEIIINIKKYNLVLIGF